MSWFPGDYGDVWVDDETGQIAPPEVYGSTVPPELVGMDDPRYQDYGPPGPGYSYLVAPGKPIAQYLDTAPETISAAGSLLKTAMPVVDAAGRYFQYKRATVDGREVYQRAPYTGGVFGLSPMMLFAIGAVGFVALSGKSK